jgi:hypothetical protein
MMAIGGLWFALLTASVAVATASSTEYRHYVGCGVTEHTPKARACSKASQKGAFFESVNSDVYYKVCVEFPTHKRICSKKPEQALKGTLYVNSIHSNIPGKHTVTWYVAGKRVGATSFTVGE